MDTLHDKRYFNKILEQYNVAEKMIKHFIKTKKKKKMFLVFSNTLQS